jgi:hypothetical protein
MSSTDALLHRLPKMLFLGLTAAVVIILGVHSWLASRDAIAQLAATVAAEKQVLDRAANNEQQRNTALAKALAGISLAKRHVQTPAEAIAQIPQVLPPLPEPISFTLPAPTSTQPAPPAEASIPSADLKPLYDYMQDCRACSAKLAAADGDLADERAKVAALTTERDAATDAAKGGGFWLRVKRGAKWLAVGAALGALAAEAPTKSVKMPSAQRIKKAHLTRP